RTPAGEQHGVLPAKPGAGAGDDGNAVVVADGHGSRPSLLPPRARFRRGFSRKIYRADAIRESSRRDQTVATAPVKGRGAAGWAAARPGFPAPDRRPPRRNARSPARYRGA